MGTYQNKWNLREDWNKAILNRLFKPPRQRINTEIRRIAKQYMIHASQPFYFRGITYYPYPLVAFVTSVPLPKEATEEFLPTHEYNLILIDERIMLDAFITKMLRECSCNKDLYLLLPKTLSENQRAMTSGKPEPNITEEQVIQFKADNKMGYQLIAERLAKNMLDM